MNQYSERRSESRLYFKTLITIEESDVSFSYRARLANHSERGLYFETDLLLNPGEKVYVRIQNSKHSFLVEIIWRKPLTEISFNYGYGAKMILHKVEKKSQKKDRVKLIELRKTRRKLFSKLVYFASENKYYKGTIKNLSHEGAFIQARTKFSNGGEIRLVVPGPNKYLQIRCKIIHFNETGFGVKFKSVLKIEKLAENK